MRSDAARNRAPRATADMTERAIGATFDFVRAAAADSAILNEVPDGATLVLVPDDDVDLAAAEVEQGIAALRRGDNVYFRHLRQGASPSERTWDEADELDRRYAAVWTRLEKGELTPREAKEQSLALLKEASFDAVRIATRRRRIRTETRREQGGADPSPALAGIQALLDEVGEALDSGTVAAIDVNDVKRRMADHLAELRREVAGT